MGMAQPWNPWAPPPTTNGLAIASLVLSILTLFGIGSILGIIFGFVSRGQIRRSNGAQKGAGLALAGIIVSFVTLSLVLLAVAIPTFLGVRASTGASVGHLPLASIALGTPVEGGQAPQVPWASKSQPVDTTLTAVPGGVMMHIAGPEHSEWAGLPLTQPPGESMQLSAAVAIIGGTTSNSIGLGCITPTQSEHFIFVVHRSGAWQIALLSGTDPATIVDAGVSPAVHHGGSNQLTIACNAEPGSRSDRRRVRSEWVPSGQRCRQRVLDPVDSERGALFVQWRRHRQLSQCRLLLDLRPASGFVADLRRLPPGSVLTSRSRARGRARWPGSTGASCPLPTGTRWPNRYRIGTPRRPR